MSTPSPPQNNIEITITNIREVRCECRTTQHDECNLAQSLRILRVFNRLILNCFSALDECAWIAMCDQSGYDR